MDDFKPVEGRQEETPSNAALQAGHDETIGALTAQLETAFEAGDYVTVAQLFERDLLATWFGTKPDRLQQMLGTLM